MPSPCLLVAAVASFGVALLHLGLAFSPTLSRTLGAPEELLAAGPGALIVASFAIALVFGIWGVYALSGSGVVRRLPALRPVLLAIGAIYTLRGLGVLPQLLARARLVDLGQEVHAADIASSLVALAIGVVHLVGITARWSRMGPAPDRVGAQDTRSA